MAKSNGDLTLFSTFILTIKWDSVELAARGQKTGTRTEEKHFLRHDSKSLVKLEIVTD